MSSKQHPADVFKKESSERIGFEKEIEKRRKSKKDVKITYKKLAKNNVIAKRVTLLKGRDKGIYLADGRKTGENEQLVFEVIMSGEITDDYAAFDTKDLKPGTRIIINRWGEFPHEENVKAVTESGEDIQGYYMIEARNIVAIVDYEKL
jgi:hypothetical protein